MLKLLTMRGFLCDRQDLRLAPTPSLLAKSAFISHNSDYCLHTVYMNKLFIGRHGGTEDRESLADASRMASLLKQAGFTRGIILASTAPWVVDTARVIQAETGSALYRSPYIMSAGKHPQPIESLHSFAKRFMGACAIAHDGSDIMVVTHAPLVRAVVGALPEFGQIYPVNEGWTNPQYEPRSAFLLDSGSPW